MKGRPTKNDLVSEIIIFLGLIIVVALIFRFWIVVFPALIAFIVLKLIKHFRKKEEPVKPVEEAKETVQPELSFQEMWYTDVLNSITQMVQDEYPNAKWVWEHPNARKSIENGNPVRIILNNAGGYRKAKVIIQGFIVKELDFTIEKKQEKNETSEEVEELMNVSTGAVVNKNTEKKNFELLAYDWVQANIMMLNERCNEAIGQGLKEILLTAEELPVKDSWGNICIELAREEIKNVECVPEGIKINLTKE